MSTSVGREQPGPIVAESLRLSIFLRAQRDAVLAEWLQRVAALPQARPLERPRLMDHMPELLDRMAELAEQAEAGEPARLPQRIPDIHALERLADGFDLEAVAAEYGLLRRCLLERLEAQGAPLRPGELVLLNEMIDHAISRSTASYASARERTLRGLDRISEAALVHHDVDAFLPHLLRMLVETTVAVDSAAVLLREGDLLRARAAVGVDAERMAGFQTRVGEGFAGAIAEQRQPVALRCTPASALAVGLPGRAPGLRALYGVPLLHGEELIGVAHMGSCSAFEFSEEDRLFFRTMTSRATALIVQAQLVASERRARAEAERARNWMGLLAEANKVLVSSLDLRTILEGTVRLVVPALADWCVVDLVEPDGGLRAAALAHVDPGREGLLRRLRERWPIDPHASGGIARIAYTGEPLLIPHVTQAHLGEVARDPEHLAALAQLGLTSVMGLPLLARGRLLGVLSLAHSSAERRFGAEDLERAEELARHVALAVDNARLHAEMRTSEDRARETSERLRAILDAALDGIITIDERGVMESVNPAVERIFGYTPRELLGRNVSMLMPEPDRSRHDGYLDHYLRTGERRVIGLGREVRGQRKDGSVFPLQLSVAETHVRGRRRFTGTVSDISRRKQAEEVQALLLEAGTALSHSLDLPTTLRNLASLAVRHFADYCLVDLMSEEGRLHRMEVAARDPGRLEPLRRFMGWPPELRPEGALARSLDRGEPLALAQLTAAQLDALAAHAEARGVLEELALRSAIVVPLLARGRQLGLIHFGCTEPHRMARPESVEVARGVADRAAVAIDNARLYREAQEAVRVREDLVAIVSHDLRNPLNAISLSAAQLLGEVAAGERTARAVRRIASAAERASRLIGDLLDFTRARVGGMPLAPHPLNLHELARQVVDEVRVANPTRAVSLVTEGEGGGEWDAGRMAQVLTNLVGNAIQHSPPGSPVQVVVRGEDAQVVLEVHNGGAPIGPDVLPLLFEPFRRGPGAGHEGKSLGLGLFIARQIVEAHHGSIEVTSTAAAGTTFRVRLPSSPRA